MSFGLRRVSWKLPMPQSFTNVRLLAALDGVTNQLEDLQAIPALSSSPCAARIVQLSDMLDDLVAAAESFVWTAESDEQVVAHALSQCKVAAARLRSGDADMDDVARVLSLAAEQMRARVTRGQHRG